jgi:hypothetical protein
MPQDSAKKPFVGADLKPLPNPFQPKPGTYGAEGDPWVYTVDGSGGVQVAKGGAPPIAVRPGSYAHENMINEIKSQIESGQLRAIGAPVAPAMAGAPNLGESMQTQPGLMQAHLQAEPIQTSPLVQAAAPAPAGPGIGEAAGGGLFSDIGRRPGEGILDSSARHAGIGIRLAGTSPVTVPSAIFNAGGAVTESVVNTGANAIRRGMATIQRLRAKYGEGVRGT